MNLLTLQRTMAKAVMHPLTHSEHMSKHASNGEPMAEYAAKFIKPNDRLTSFERLEIYNRQYWWRLMSSLAEDFPGLQAILGNRRFEGQPFLRVMILCQPGEPSDTLGVRRTPECFGGKAI